MKPAGHFDVIAPNSMCIYIPGVSCLPFFLPFLKSTFFLGAGKKKGSRKLKKVHDYNLNESQ